MSDNKKILVVDDSSDMRMLMERLLMREGYEVICAQDGLECLNVLSTDETIDLVFLDIKMPNLDGFGVLEKLNDIRASHPQLKVAIVSGLKDKADIIRGLKLKADDYILKPIDPQIVTAKTKVLLGEADHNNSFAWLEKHMGCELTECVAKVRFTLVNISENRFVIESSVEFIKDVSFAFHSEKLSEFLQVPDLELRARVDICEVLSPTAPRFRIFATFIGVPENIQQKLRSLTMKNVRRK